MAPPLKYTDFVETPLGVKPGKNHPWDPQEYVGITCPECDVLFVELTTQSLKATKASHCLDHVRKCEAYAQAHGSAEPVRKRAKKTTPGEQLLLERMQQMQTDFQAQLKGMEERIVGAVSEAAELGPPPPTGEAELVARIQEQKRNEQREREQLDEELDPRNADVDPAKCVSCATQRRRIVNRPCNHMVECVSCSASWRAECLRRGGAHTCIQCRQPVRKALPVHF